MKNGTSARPDAALSLVAHLFEDPLPRAGALVRDDPGGFCMAAKPLLIAPLWQYVELSSKTCVSRQTGLDLLEVLEGVLRHVDAGNPERASWEAEKVQAAADAFMLACSTYLVYDAMPKAQAQKKRASKASAAARASDPDTKKSMILKAAPGVRQSHVERDVASVLARRFGVTDQYVRRVLKKEIRT